MPDTPNEPRFCTQCGSQLASDARFCASCGAPVAAPSAPATTGPDGPAPAPAPTRSRVRRFWRVALPVWLALTVLGFAGSFAYGWFTAEPAAPEPSPDQQEVLGRLGEPEAFWLTDGPGTPGESDLVRIEEWFYPTEGAIVTFFDGAKTQEYGVTFSVEYAPPSVRPTELGRWMTQADVESLLGETGTPADAPSAGYPDYEAFTYPESRLAIGYSGGQLLSAQTY
ncbi:MAG: zinc ribbon domain-containing protein [Actinomycetota bacterium]|nr:zinc ribbon domain-containing protein [Actinomycetota bacterium]